MFFLLRSAVCIGLVVAALPSGGASLPERGTFADAVTPYVASAVGHLCADATERCLGIATEGWRVLGGGNRLARTQRPSQDTLTSSDLRPHWAGRVLISRN